MAPHSSTLAWRIPGTGEPGGPLSVGLHRVGHDWCDLAAAAGRPGIWALWSQSWFYNLVHCLLSFQFSSVTQSFPTLRDPMDMTAACQAFLSVTNSWSLLKLMSIELVMPSNHLILCHPLLLLPSVFPSIRVFPRSQFFTSGGQSTEVSFPPISLVYTLM